MRGVALDWKALSPKPQQPELVVGNVGKEWWQCWEALTVLLKKRG